MKAYYLEKLQEQYVYCPECKSFIDKSFSQCPRCEGVVRDPMRCDEKTLLKALTREGDDGYRKYAWAPKTSIGEISDLTIEYYSRVFSIKNRKLVFIKKSSENIGSCAFRLVVDLSQDDLDRIQDQLERTPFAKWITSLNNLDPEYDYGGTDINFELKCNNSVHFLYAGSYEKAPGYLDLCALLWNIVTSSPDYFRKLDEDPAYEIKRVEPEVFVKLYCESFDEWKECRVPIGCMMRIGSENDDEIRMDTSMWRESSIGLFCRFDALYFPVDSGACVEKDGFWQEVTEDMAICQGDRIRIRDIVFAVHALNIINPSSKYFGAYQKRLAKKYVEAEIFREIDRQILQKNIEAVCEMLLESKGESKEGTVGSRPTYPTAGFSPWEIIYPLFNDPPSRKYLKTVPVAYSMFSNMCAAQVLLVLSNYESEDCRIESTEEEVRAINRNILKLLLRLDDLLEQWQTENDRI